MQYIYCTTKDSVGVSYDYKFLFKYKKYNVYIQNITKYKYINKQTNKQ